MLSSSLFYNAIAHVYESYCESSNINECVEQEIALLESYHPDTVLEFGVGDGRFARQYITRNPAVYYVGVDNAKEMLLYAKNSRAILVLCDFKDYLKQLIVERKKFDVIVAPYTVIHHIPTEAQSELFENMKDVAKIIIINCLTLEEEKNFKGSSEIEVAVAIPGQEVVTTMVYKLSPHLRDVAQVIPESIHREFLVYHEETK